MFEYLDNVDEVPARSMRLVAHPKAIAPAVARPSAADLPRPRDAVIEHVCRNALSVIESSNFSSTLP